MVSLSQCKRRIPLGQNIQLLVSATPAPILRVSLNRPKDSKIKLAKRFAIFSARAFKGIGFHGTGVVNVVLIYMQNYKENMQLKLHVKRSTHESFLRFKCFWGENFSKPYEFDRFN